MQFQLNVLADHHARNRAPRPPQPEVLHEIAMMQARHSSKEDEDNDGDDDEDNDDDEEKPAEKSRRKPQGQYKPTDLSYYKGRPIYNALREAKKLFHYYLIFEQPFPIREDHLGHAEEVLRTVIRKLQDDGSAVSGRLFCLLSICNLTFPCQRMILSGPT